MTDVPSRLSYSEMRYLRNAELRREICRALELDADDRFNRTDAALRKHQLVEVARALAPDDYEPPPLPEGYHGEEDPFKRLTLQELYPLICEWADTEYQGTAGKQWGLSRENLKAVLWTLTWETARG